MAPFKRKPPQPAMSKAELRAQGVQALAQVTTPITKLVEPGEAVLFDLQLASYHEAGRPRRPHQEPFRAPPFVSAQREPGAV